MLPVLGEQHLQEKPFASALGRYHTGGANIPQHLGFSKKISKFYITRNKDKLEIITSLALGAVYSPRKLPPGGQV